MGTDVWVKKTTSQSGTSQVSVARGNQDAFGRLRVSQPTELFAASNEMIDHSLHYENKLVGTASSLYDSDKSTVFLSVSTNGDIATRSSRYIRYRPAKSQQIFITGNFSGSTANTIKRMGYFDNDDGLFFELNDSNLSVVLRSSTSGSSVETRIARSDWNGDKLDSTGESGVTLDLTKQQVMIIDFGWLGSAIVRFYFVVNGEPVLVHSEYPSNSLDYVFMKQAVLPVRWEIESTGGTTSISATCASVQSEGGFQTKGVKRSVSMDGNPVAFNYNNGSGDSDLVPLLTVRLKSAYNRASIIPLSYTIFAYDGNNSFEFQILRNCNLSGTSYSDSSELTEFDITASNVITSGEVIFTTYGTAGGGPIKSGSSVAELASDIPISSDIDGNSDTITIAVRPIAGNNSTNVVCSLVWNEYY